MDSEQAESKVFEAISPINEAQPDSFKYVQVHRKQVRTIFTSHEVLQIIDVSKKVQCDKAQGEKKLISLINATVSHEMRNPVNSISV